MFKPTRSMDIFALNGKSIIIQAEEKYAVRP